MGSGSRNELVGIDRGIDWVSIRVSISHISHQKLRHKCRGSTDMSQQMIFVDRIAVAGVLSLSTDIGKIRHSTVTLLFTTTTEVLTAAQMQHACMHAQMPACTRHIHRQTCMHAQTDGQTGTSRQACAETGNVKEGLSINICSKLSAPNPKSGAVHHGGTVLIRRTSRQRWGSRVRL